MIYGNLIGTDAGGTANLGNQGDGIDIGSPNNTVGGTSAGLANIIAFNTKSGVGFEQLNTNTGNLLSANSIYSNQQLGIDLAATGVPLQNTAGGPHVGPNDLQNYPVLASAIDSSGGTVISGSLNSTPNQTFTIQFFSNPAADASSYGQAQTYVGSTTAYTDSSGNADFIMTVPAHLAGQSLSATAIAAGGNTSEFAKNILVVSSPTTPTPIATTTTLNVSPNPSTAGEAITVTATVSASDGSLPTGDVTFFIDGQAQTPVEPLQIVGGRDVATFVTSPTLAGSHVISAQYGGTSIYSGSLSNSVAQTIQSLLPIASPTSTAPTVTSVRWVGYHGQPPTIVLSFSEGLDPASAQNTANYTILTTGRHGEFGKGSQMIRTTKAVYDAGSRTVTLYPARRLNIEQRYELIVSGEAPAGIASANTVMLDGADSGTPGSDYVTVLDKQNFVFVPTPKPPRLKPAAAVVRIAHATLKRGK